MKRTILQIVALSALAATSLVGAPPEKSGEHRRGPHGGGRQGGRGQHLERLTETLDLTPEQKAKIQPIIEQARPQIRAIHQEAMQKTQAVMENAMAQMRPLLTPEQQKKADELKTAHQNLRKAMKEMHEAKAK
jgi:Spy/CpxP family protein refolding chaperone